MAVARLLDRPVAGSVTRSGLPKSPRPLNADHIEFGAYSSTPFRARRHTRLFLGGCGFSCEMIETAQAVVSELTTDAFNATAFSTAGGLPPDRPACSELVKAGIIGLSLRHFSDGLLVEVIDTSPQLPVLVEPGAYSEHGRGLWIVATLSREWGCFPVHDGKCVYSVLDITW